MYRNMYTYMYTYIYIYAYLYSEAFVDRVIYIVGQGVNKYLSKQTKKQMHTRTTICIMYAIFCIMYLYCKKYMYYTYAYTESIKPKEELRWRVQVDPQPTRMPQRRGIRHL